MLPLLTSTTQLKNPLDSQVMNSSAGEQAPVSLRIPLEITFNVIDQLVTTTRGEAVPVALPASHPTTKALLSFAIACKETNTRALRHLYTYCLYIDTIKSLESFAITLRHHEQGKSHLPTNILSLARNLYLDLGERYYWQFGNSHVADIITVLKALGPNLRTLVAEFPPKFYDSLYNPNRRNAFWNADDYVSKGNLIDAFRPLKSLQSFTFMGHDDIFRKLSWLRCPLKTISVGCVGLSERSVWRYLGSMKSLEILIIHTPNVYSPSETLQHWLDVNGSSNTIFHDGYDSKKPTIYGRHLTIVFVNLNADLVNYDSRADSSPSSEAVDRVLTIRHVHDPLGKPYGKGIRSSYYDEEDLKMEQRSWLKGEMVKLQPMEKWIENHKWDPSSIPSQPLQPLQTPDIPRPPLLISLLGFN